MEFNLFLEKCSELKNDHVNFVIVTIVSFSGSIPQEIGAKMLVTQDGLFSGTIGGGKIENAAIVKAKELLLNQQLASNLYIEWNLQKDIGMSCGGKMGLFFESCFNLASWSIVVFGAGHISQELIKVLLRLNCNIKCIDSREEWLSRFQPNPKLQLIKMSNLFEYVDKLEGHEFVAIATMGHATDLPILEKIFKLGLCLPYLGVIGSEVKALKLRKNLIDLAISEQQVQKFYCPMGEKIGNNTPAEIAISIVAQLLKVRDQKK